MPMQEDIERFYAQDPKALDREAALRVFGEFKTLLNRGAIRAAEPASGLWKTNHWVKKGILLGFRLGVMNEIETIPPFRFFDNDTFPIKHLTLSDGVRIVPGGSTIRDGAYVAASVVCMPPMYINVGAYVDEQTMIDSHALVGSCAQVGKRVHLSAAAQIGGVLEPIGSLPVIIEDDVLVGGNTGIYEGTIVQRGAVIGAGVILTGGTPVFDLVHQKTYRKEGDQPLVIPARAVVIPGSRPVAGDWAKREGLSVATPIIIKYRDAKTSASTALEESLR
jgi:2,3,4,5-tetrahydropyridine-2-carboxylate N-succinyltransferase